MLPTAAARVLLISAFLASGARKADGPELPPPPDGRTLAAELGCAACHAGIGTPDVIRGRAPALGPGSPQLPASFVFTYLERPERRRPDIGSSRMPTFDLDEGERLALALFLGTPDGDRGLPEARSRHPGADAETGRRIFEALGCAGCHAGVPSASPVPGPDLGREGARVTADWLRGYLAMPVTIRGDGHPSLRGARMPDFRLEPEEAQALADFLGEGGRPFAAPDTARLTDFEAARTERALEGRFSCRGCHRIGGRGGELGPSLDGIAGRRKPSYVLEMILDPGRAAPGAPMPHQPLPAREADRVARYLLALPPEGPPTAPRSLTAADHPARLLPTTPSSEGESLYARHCAACHGVRGAGDGWNAPNLPVPPTAHADAGLMSRRPDDTLYDGIFSGAWVLDGSPRMPAFGGLLTPREIRALVGYIRTLCSCQGPAWSRDGKRGGA